MIKLDISTISIVLTPQNKIYPKLMSGNNQSFLGENYLAMSLVSVSEKPFVVKFLQEKRKFLPVFSGSRITKSNKQKLNCRCQELDPRHFIVSLVPTWRIFTLPNEFYHV